MAQGRKTSAGGNSTTAKKKSSASRNGSSSKKRISEEQRLRLEQTKRRRQSVAVVLFTTAILFFIFIIAPGVSDAATEIVRGLFGRSAIVWCILLFYVSVLLALDSPERPVGRQTTRVAFLAVLVSSFIHCVMQVSGELGQLGLGDAIGSLYSRGTLREGAGLIGGLVATIAVAAFGRVLSIILIILIGFIMFMLMSQTGLMQLFSTVSKPVKSASEKAGELAALRAQEREERRRAEQEAREQALMVSKALRASRIEVLNPSSEDPSSKPSKKSKRYRFEFDVPVDDLPVTPSDDGREETAASTGAEVMTEGITAEEMKQGKVKSFGSSAVSDVLEILNSGEKKQAPVNKAKQPEQSTTEPPEDPDGAFEELLQKVAGRSKKQREAEIAMQASQFAMEVGSQSTEEISAQDYRFPPIELLMKPDDTNEGDIRVELKQNAERLVETLREYSVETSVVDICRGPAVTRYELKPAPGVKISKITSLTNDIALRLAAQAIRIEAPIPGKAAIGVEIPNQTASTVYVRELIDSELFRNAKSPVTVSIGKDIDGNIILADLAKMPHLLIAGSTGMGKSVCVNSMLVSMIYKSSPADVRMIMVDPKQVELDVYNGIPHLLVPVVCDPKKAAGALQWAVSEMDKRYSLLHEHNVRNIDGYNKLAEKTEGMSHMPRIVIIIDEMADLMTTSPKEVENAIARLAAMARAAGMHMVLATQRPSVDVITGTIKNNIPSRIAFAVSSQVDSRTILDEGGAEGLIGRGDMLFKPVGSKAKRVQGCFVDEEVKDIVEFIKQNGTAEYDESIAMEIERNASGGEELAGETEESFSEDPLFTKAIEVVIEAGQASTSMLQRRLGVGYARAGRLIDELADRGVIGPFEGSKPRRVLMSRQQYLEMTMMRDSAVQQKAERPEPSLPTQPEQAAAYQPPQPDSLPSVEQDLIYQPGAVDEDGFDPPPF